MTTVGGSGAGIAGLSATAYCARRGRQWLSRQDLQAHLAALLRLENVGLFLGAGASMGPLGGKTMAELWADFSTTYPNSEKWLEAEGFVAPGSTPNCEDLADDLEIAAREWQRATNSKEPALAAVRGDFQRCIISAALLQPDLWTDPGKNSLDLKELGTHREVLQKLTAARQPGQSAPWIFTTNYDLAIEWAAESINLKVINGFDGLHCRSFSPHNFDLGWRNVLARGEARFGTYHVYLGKLHGSLAWFESGNDAVLEASAAARWPIFEGFLNKKSPTMPGVLVLPSTTKYDRTVGFVLGEIFRRFAEFLARPQSCLITSGYSFSDEHLNRLLVTALQNPTLQLVVYLPEAVRDADVLDLGKTSAWARRVMALESPQVTIVGGGPMAHFEVLAADLPDPAIYDDQAARMRQMLRELRDGPSIKGTP